jgi:hypothetical protein
MTLMNGYDVCGVDPMDEEYFGPAPRFLRERPRAANDDTTDVINAAPARAWRQPFSAFRGWLRRLIA